MATEEEEEEDIPTKSEYFKYIERNEGTRYKPYSDLYGHSTIGVGHLIKKEEKFGKIDDKGAQRK